MFPIQDTIPTQRFPLVNWLIIGLNTAVFIIEAKLPEEGVKELFYHFGLVPARYTDAEWAQSMGYTSAPYWTFLSNTFLHGGFGHFLGNMWTLYIFGDNVEDSMGRGRYLIFYLLCGAIASFSHFYLNLSSTVPAIGASGAIAAVMGAYMFLYPKSRIIFFIPIFFIPYFFELNAFFYLAVWFFVQLVSGTATLMASGSAQGIAFWAHIGGFAAGVILFKLFIKRSAKKDYLGKGNYDLFQKG